MNMFTSTKAPASLTSGLLARKGQAKPAMRPQGFGIEDLGWNDMGQDVPRPVPAPVAASQPVVPPVLRQREVLAEEIAPPAPAAPASLAPITIVAEPQPQPVAVKQVSVATATRISREVGRKKSKAAFTLRLDAGRHLRLRLASAVCNQSAQNIVSQALDAFLEALPEVEALASQLPPPKAGR